MILSLVQKFRTRRQLAGSIGPLLRRADDHLLEDIGLTRAEADALLRDPPLAPGAKPGGSYRVRLV